METWLCEVAVLKTFCLTQKINPPTAGKRAVVLVLFTASHKTTQSL